ncbi:hypothetical protein C8Q73DRAFT_262668 [Cubamyces lactineus]|nr:hypothetical protein C8Q73DRAFT_262668 [Cubamyces lactineus]
MYSRLATIALSMATCQLRWASVVPYITQPQGHNKAPDNLLLASIHLTPIHSRIICPMFSAKKDCNSNTPTLERLPGSRATVLNIEACREAAL